MASINKKVLQSGRVRQIPPSGFSWLDRRFVTGGFAAETPQHELLLYLFLCIVSDHQGLSFYGDRRLCEILKLSTTKLDAARRGLEKRDLIVYRYPLYQVLSLPEEPTGPLAAAAKPQSYSGASSIGDVIRRLY
jgi:hypothetical protein